MGKFTGTILVKGLLFFFVGLFLTAQGIPTDPTSATIMVSEATISSIDQSYNDPYVKGVIDNGKEAFRTIGFGMTVIGFLEILILMISFFKDVSGVI